MECNELNLYIIDFQLLSRYKVLQMTSTINDIGSMRWELVLFGALLWVVVYFCIWKGVKSVGKVSFVVKRITGLFKWETL